MVQLRCAMVSGGHAFSIQIDLDATVEQMKWLILVKSPEFGRYGTSSFTVFLAKDSNGNWLKSADDSVFSVADERIADAIKSATAQRPLEGDERLSSSTCFGADFVPHADNIYVLVVPATPNKRRRVEDDSSVGALRLAASGCSRTVKIWCAMVGEGGQFPIKIDLDATVEEMKELILVKNLEFARFGTRALTVFLAKDSDGKWIKSADDDVSSGVGKRLPDAFKAAMSRQPLADSDILSSDACFGTDFVPHKGDIYVLVRLPSAVWSLEYEGGRDGSAAWLAVLRAYFFASSALPSMDALGLLMASSLPVKIGLSRVCFEIVARKVGAEILDKMFVCDEQTPCSTVWEHVVRIAVYPSDSGKSNSVLYWDLVIRQLLVTLFGMDSLDLVELDPSRAEDDLPGLAFQLDGVYVFRGKEVAPGVTDLDVPIREACARMTWTFGENVPYVLGYTASGYRCALYAMYTRDGSTVESKQIGMYETENATQRLEVLLALLQLTRLFRGIADSASDARMVRLAPVETTDPASPQSDAMVPTTWGSTNASIDPGHFEAKVPMLRGSDGRNVQCTGDVSSRGIKRAYKDIDCMCSVADAPTLRERHVTSSGAQGVCGRALL